MSGVYVDTSALGRVLLWEPDAPAILSALDGFDEHVASRLLATELRRLAMRRGLGRDAESLLESMALIGLDEPILALADAVRPPGVGTLDAIHLATAIWLARDGFVEAVLTYDERLAEGAHEHGLEVLAPG